MKYHSPNDRVYDEGDLLVLSKVSCPEKMESFPTFAAAVSQHYELKNGMHVYSLGTDEEMNVINNNGSVYLHDSIHREHPLREPSYLYIVHHDDKGLEGIAFMQALNERMNTVGRLSNLRHTAPKGPVQFVFDQVSMAARTGFVRSSREDRARLLGMLSNVHVYLNMFT